MLTPSQIGRNLAVARDRAGYHQKPAAAKLKVHEQTLSRYELGKGKKPPPLPVLQRAAVLYGVTVDVLTTQIIESDEALSETVSRGTSPVESIRDQADVERNVERVRGLATQFNIRRAQKAEFDELLGIRRELVAAVKDGLRAAGGRDPYFNDIVEALVDLLTLQSKPPTEELALPTSKAAKKIANDRGR